MGAVSAEYVAPLQGAGSLQTIYPGHCPGLVCSTLCRVVVDAFRRDLGGTPYTTNLKDRQMFEQVQRPTGAGSCLGAVALVWLAALPPYRFSNRSNATEAASSSLTTVWAPAFRRAAAVDW